MNKKINRKFIAEIARVSPTTVSYVVNDPATKKIGKEAKQRVLKAIKKYNYFPNSAARTLNMSKTFNIGFITNYPLSSFLADPFQNEIFSGIVSAIEEHEYGLLFSLLKKVELESTDDINFSAKKMILGNVVDGVILFGKFDLQFIKFVKNTRMKYVLVDYAADEIKSNAVLPDNINGAYEATQYLIKQDLHKIYCINGDVQHPSYLERPLGYKQAMAKYGLKPKVFNVLVTHGGIYNFIVELIKKKDLPEAMFGTGDYIAREIIRALEDYDIKVPDKIKVIGFDNCIYPGAAPPKLTTIHIPKVEMGREAIRLLLKKIKKDDGPEIIRMPTHLVIRETA